MGVRQAIEAIGYVVDLAGVILIVLGLLIATARYVLALSGHRADAYRRFRQDIGRAILLGLEVLVAADIVRTVAVEPSLENVAVLAVIVAIRTFLSISLQVELEGRFPWQRKRDHE